MDREQSDGTQGQTTELLCEADGELVVVSAWTIADARALAEQALADQVLRPIAVVVDDDVTELLRPDNTWAAPCGADLGAAREQLLQARTRRGNVFDLVARSELVRRWERDAIERAARMYEEAVASGDLPEDSRILGMFEASALLLRHGLNGDDALLRRMFDATMALGRGVLGPGRGDDSHPAPR